MDVSKTLQTLRPRTSGEALFIFLYKKDEGGRGGDDERESKQVERAYYGTKGGLLVCPQFTRWRNDHCVKRTVLCRS